MRKMGQGVKPLKWIYNFALLWIVELIAMTRDSKSWATACQPLYFGGHKS